MLDISTFVYKFVNRFMFLSNLANFHHLIALTNIETFSWKTIEDRKFRFS